MLQFDLNPPRNVLVDAKFEHNKAMMGAQVDDSFMQSKIRTDDSSSLFVNSMLSLSSNNDIDQSVIRYSEIEADYANIVGGTGHIKKKKKVKKRKTVRKCDDI